MLAGDIGSNVALLVEVSVEVVGCRRVGGEKELVRLYMVDYSGAGEVGGCVALWIRRPTSWNLKKGMKTT